MFAALHNNHVPGFRHCLPQTGAHNHQHHIHDEQCNQPLSVRVETARDALPDETSAVLLESELRRETGTEEQGRHGHLLYQRC